MTKRFEIGKTYTDRSACDHETIFAFTVTKRTAKMVTIVAEHRAPVARKVRLDDDGVEMIDPLGRYSMSPVLRADRVSA